MSKKIKVVKPTGHPTVLPGKSSEPGIIAPALEEASKFVKTKKT
jgi:hypothetical protein